VETFSEPTLKTKDLQLRHPLNREIWASRPRRNAAKCNHRDTEARRGIRTQLPLAEAGLPPYIPLVIATAPSVEAVKERWRATGRLADLLESRYITFAQWHAEMKPERQTAILKEAFGGKV